MPLKPDYILSVLYDLTSTMAEEVKLDPLLKKVLKKMQLHTSASAGLIFFCDEQGKASYTLKYAIGDGIASRHIGCKHDLQQKLISMPDSSLVCDDTFNDLPIREGTYKQVIKLNIPTQGFLLLFFRTESKQKLFLEIFTPSMRSFSKAIKLCTLNDQHTDSLLQVIQSKERDLVDVNLSLRLTEFVLQNSIDGVIITDNELSIIRLNPAFEKITGYSEKEALGQKPSFTSSGYHGKDFYRKMWQVINEKGSWTGEIWDRKKTGEVYPKSLTILRLSTEGGDSCNYIGIFRDISSEKRSEERIRELASFDALTELPNRAEATRIINNLICTDSEEARVGIFFININNFKKVNDSLGFKAGDQLLIEFARRLQGLYPESVARLSADEFLLYLSNTDHISGNEVIQNTLHLFKKPFQCFGNELFISASIGVSFSPSDSTDAEQLMQQASIAMRRAKKDPAIDFSFFDNLEHEKNLYLFSLESDLRHGLENKEFHLLYQPKVSIQHGEKICSVEALIRWNKNGEIIPPNDFIPLAESSGFIIPLSNWVMQEATEAYQKFFAQAGIPVAINLSASHFHHPDLISSFQNILAQSNTPAECIELELTESTIMDNVDHAITIMQELKDLGFKLSIDDFGTGYSSLSYLKTFPLNTLKIDRSFIIDMTRDRQDLAIVNSVISLAHELGLDVVAEGVEEEDQMTSLRDSGCDLIQGYYYSPPVSADKVVSMLGKPLR